MVNHVVLSQNFLHFFLLGRVELSPLVGEEEVIFIIFLRVFFLDLLCFNLFHLLLMKLAALYGRELVEVSQHTNCIAVYIWREKALVNALPESRGLLQPAHFHVF